MSLAQELRRIEDGYLAKENRLRVEALAMEAQLRAERRTSPATVPTQPESPTMRDPAREDRIRLECLNMALRGHGDPVALAERFYAFVQASSVSDSKRDSLDASDRAASSVNATRDTIMRDEGSASDTESKPCSVGINDGAQKASITTPSREAMTGTPSAKTGTGSGPTIGGLSDGIYVLAGGNLRCIHAGPLNVVKTADGWLSA